MRYKHKQNYTWSAALAYFVGLMTSDGCLVNDNRHITMTSKDIEIILSTQTILNKKTKIRTKRGQFDTEAFHFQFSDVALYDFLKTLALRQQKAEQFKE